MTTKYPAKIDTAITLPPAIDLVTPVDAKVYNDLRAAVIAIEEELGVKPSGIYGTVRARLDFLEARGGGGGGSQTLSQVLTLGNSTGGHDVVLTPGDSIVGAPINLNGNTVINGKLTVTGLIDPTGLQLSQQTSTPTPSPTNAGTVWVHNDAPTSLAYTDSSGVSRSVPLPESPATPQERNVLAVDSMVPELNFPTQLVYDGTHIWGLKSNDGIIVSGSLPTGLSTRFSGGGIFKIDPVTNKYLESIQINTSGVADTSDQTQQDLFLKLLWTGTQLFAFGFNSNTSEAIIREIIRGTDITPTVFGPRIIPTFVDVIAGATWDGNKIWVAGSITGNIYRLDPSNPGVPEVTLLVGSQSADIIYDSSTSYPDSQPRLFVADPSDGNIYRVKDVHTLSPSVDASTAGTSTRLILAAGFLFGGEAGQLTRFIKDPLATDIFSGGPSFPLGVSYDPITNKGFVAYINGSAGSTTIDRIDTNLVVESTVTVNPNSYGAIPFAPFDMVVVGSNVWVPDEALSSAGQGDVFAVDVSTLTPVQTTRNFSLHYTKPGENIQYVNDPSNLVNCTWDGVSNIIAVAQFSAAPITVNIRPPTDGQRLTIIDAFGFADPSNSITISTFNIHGDSSPITAAFGSITLISVGLGVWEVESRNPSSGAAPPLSDVLVAGNFTLGTSIIVTSGDNILGQNPPFGQGGDVPIIAGAGNSGFSGGSVIITGGAAGALANAGFVNIKGGSAPATGGGGTVNISGGDALSNGNGGPIVITGGTPTNGAGGAITITGGVGDTGNGGDISVIGGAGAGGGSFGGTINITGGPGSIIGGNVLITSGTQTTVGNSGFITISTATPSSGAGGPISLTVGSASSGSGASGQGISLVPGDGDGITGNGGDLVLGAGRAGTVAGTHGTIRFSVGSSYHFLIVEQDEGSSTDTYLRVNFNGNTPPTFRIGYLTANLSSANGGAIAITGQGGGPTNIGGAVTLTGGAGGTTSGAGGAININGGTPTDGDGGSIFLTGHAGVGTNRLGGSITLNAGDGTGSANAGSIVLSAGNTSSGQAGQIILAPGTSSTSGVFISGANSTLVFDQVSTRPWLPSSTQGDIWVRNNTHQTLMFSTNDGYDLAATWTYPSTQTITGNHTAINGERVWYDPTGGTFTLTAPASPNMGHKWAIKNINTDATSITVSGNGSNIEDPVAGSLVSSFTFGSPLGSITWEYNGITWLVV